MSFDKIFDLTAAVYFNFYIYRNVVMLLIVLLYAVSWCAVALFF